jgi:hypothetical protein
VISFRAHPKSRMILSLDLQLHSQRPCFQRKSLFQVTVEHGFEGDKIQPLQGEYKGSWDVYQVQNPSVVSMALLH